MAKKRDEKTNIFYVFRSAKSKPEEETRRNGIPKTELVELKDRLARTELALTKLMEATKLISDKIDPKGDI